MPVTWSDVRDHIAKNTTRNSGDDGCWVWNLPLNASGYGRFMGEPAHRLAYQSHVGPIGKGLDIDHLCRNRACVNPKHLEPVTRAVNLARGIGIDLQKQKALEKGVCSNGHFLTPANVYVRPSDGARLCRVCRQVQDAKDREKTRDIRNARKREKRLFDKQGAST
jgi:hypothetical protein